MRLRIAVLLALLTQLLALPAIAEIDCSDYATQLHVVDSQPPRPSSSGYDYNTERICVNGGLLCLLEWSGDIPFDYAYYFTTYDRSDPEHPVYLGELELPITDNEGAVDAQGSYAAVAAGYWGVHIVGIADPANPVLLSTFDPAGTGHMMGVAMDGNLVYAVETSFGAPGSHGLHVLDITNPASPVEIASLPTPGTSLDCVLDGTRLYVAENEWGLRILDVSSPGAPVDLGNMPTGDKALRVAVAGGHVVLACEDDSGSLPTRRVLVVDAANAAAPTLVGELPVDARARDLKGAGNRVLMGDDSAALRVIDLTDPHSPQISGRLLGGQVGIAQDGDRIYLADGGLTTVVAGDWTSPSPLGGHAPVGSDAAALRREGLIYLASGQIAAENRGLTILDATDPTNPQPLGFAATPGYPRDIALVGDYAYLAESVSGLQVVDVSVPTAPLVAGELPPAGGADHIEAGDGHVYLLGTILGITGLHVVDVSVPSAPVRVASLPVAAPRGMALLGQHVYLATQWNGLLVVDVSTPGSPVQVDSWNAGEPSDMGADVVVTGTHAYLGIRNGRSAIERFDTSDPAHPQWIDTIELRSQPLSLALQGRYVYAGTSSGGVELVDLREPALPRLAGDLPHGSGWVDFVSTDGELLLACSLEGGLELWPLQCDDVTGAAEGSPTAGRAGLRAFPNPFNPQVTLSFHLASAACVGLDVFDAQGRLVASLPARALPAGDNTLLWQGKDGRGHELPSGVYLARLRGTSEALTGRLVLLR